MSTRCHDCRRKVSENMTIQSRRFQLYSSPYRPIWVQFGEVAFSVYCFTALYCPIWIQIGEFHLVPSKFHDSKSKQLRAQPFWLWGLSVSLTELGILSESQVGLAKRGHCSVKCPKKAGRFPHLQPCAGAVGSIWNRP